MGADAAPKHNYEAENIGLRQLLTQAGLDAARLLERAGVDALDHEAAKQLQRLRQIPTAWRAVSRGT